MAFNFDPQKYQRAIENEFTIIDKKKNEVPFVLNAAQQDVIHKLGEQNIILKARKMGFSSLMLAIATIKFLFGKNERCVSMSFDSTASSKQLLRAKQYIKAFEYKNRTRLQMKYNSKSEMMLVGIDELTGREYVNTLSVGTAKSDSFGRGDDITFLHLTEVSFCDDLGSLLTGAGEALTDDAMITLETTANGFNEFKEFWDKSERGETGFNAFFYNPTWEYSEEYLEKKRMKLGRLFTQEYPMTAIEAFIASGDPFFNVEAMRRYLEEVGGVVNAPTN